jgi:hypothetical protein
VSGFSILGKSRKRRQEGSIVTRLTKTMAAPAVGGTIAASLLNIASAQ